MIHYERNRMKILPTTILESLLVYNNSFTDLYTKAVLDRKMSASLLKIGAIFYSTKTRKQYLTFM